MVKGTPIKQRIILTNTGVVPNVPLPDDIVSDMELKFMGTANGVVLKIVKVGDGLTKESTGVYLLDIPKSITSQLPDSGDAILKGLLLPCEAPIIIDFGRITSI